MSPFLKLNNISKSFGVVKALENIHFSISKSQVIAIIGENGAGKSTLMKVLGGIHQPTQGSVEIDGETVEITDAKAAEKNGISFVHQELNLLDNLDVASNIFLGREPQKLGFINKKKMDEDSIPLLKKLGLSLHPRTKLSQLTNGQKQLVEIAKALSMKSRLIILDEPTSSLSQDETNKLLDLIKSLSQEGIAIIYISHRLNEISVIADDVFGLRDGQMAGSLTKNEINRDAMISLMIGRDLKNAYPQKSELQTGTLLEVQKFTTQRWPKAEANFQLKPGEILGFYGLIGAGRSELAQAIFGVDASPKGHVSINKKPLERGNIKQCIHEGLFLAPEDRKECSLFLEMTIRENMTLNSLKSFSQYSKINFSKEKETTQSWLKEYGVKANNINATPSSLSGGNQQKIVLSKWMTQNPKVMILDEPTRGIDIGARYEIYETISKLASQGCGIILISSDMEELLGLSHRIIAMHEGNTVGELNENEFSEEAVMKLIMSGEQ